MDLVYPPIVGMGHMFFAAMGMKIMLKGAEHIPRKGGAVLACNHVSYLDFIFCGRAARPSKRYVRFMAKKSTFDHKISGPIMRSLYHIPVDRSAGAGAYQHAVDVLRKGEIVGVFPEATISQSFELKGFKNGAARMAAEAEVPLIPMITFGGQRLWTKGHPRDMERKVALALNVGEPMHPKPGDDVDEVLAELKRRMSMLLDETLEQYPQKPPPGTWWWPARLGGGAPTLEEAERAAAEAKARKAAKADEAE